MSRDLTRRGLLAGAAATGVGAVAARLPVPTPAAAADPAFGPGHPPDSAGRTRVIMLGTLGGQNATMNVGAGTHAFTATLILVDGVGYVVDAGPGAMRRYLDLGLDISALRHAFITHHHQDHNAELGHFMTYSWTVVPAGVVPSGARRRFGVHGPPGTRDYVRGFKIAETRAIADMEQRFRPRFGRFVVEQEYPFRGAIMRNGVSVYRDARVAVSAVRVAHSVPTVGYRFRTRDRDIVFSGDRGAGEGRDGFVAFAKGADTMVHEVFAATQIRAALEQLKVPKAFITGLLADHSTPEEVGRAATAAGVRRLVLYHRVPASASADRWREFVAPYFSGEIVVPDDLTEI